MFARARTAKSSHEEHQRLHLGVNVALTTRSFPQPAKTACHSKCDHQLQEVKHKEFKFAWPLHCVSLAPTLRLLKKAKALRQFLLCVPSRRRWVALRNQRLNTQMFPSWHDECNEDVSAQFTQHVVLCGSCGRGMQIEIPTPLLLSEVS